MANVYSINEHSEPYNTKEDLLELAEEYKKTKQNGERNLWELSDLAHEAAEKYGGLKEFAKLTGENINSLKQYSSMSEIYPKSIRAYTVTYRHYMVAKSSDSRLEWLKKAQDNGWSAERLRREMTPAKPAAKKEPEPVVVPEPKWEPAVIEPQNIKPNDYRSRTFEDVVAIINYYLYKENDVYQMFGDLTILLQKVFEEERRIVFDDNQFKIVELDGSLSEHMEAVNDR